MAEETHRFEVPVSWIGDARGSGRATLAYGANPVPVAGDPRLGGAGGAANPEELLLAALGSCFLNTWAIFLAKLGVAHPEPSLRAAGELETDPAGGYRFRRATLSVRVPRSLLETDRAKLEKTLQLAEKYCIVSKAVRAAMPLTVEVEEA